MRGKLIQNVLDLKPLALEKDITAREKNRRALNCFAKISDAMNCVHPCLTPTYLGPYKKNC